MMPVSTACFPKIHKKQHFTSITSFQDGKAAIRMQQILHLLA